MSDLLVFWSHVSVAAQDRSIKNISARFWRTNADAHHTELSKPCYIFTGYSRAYIYSCKTSANIACASYANGIPQCSKSQHTHQQRFSAGRRTWQLACYAWEVFAHRQTVLISEGAGPVEYFHKVARHINEKRQLCLSHHILPYTIRLGDARTFWHGILTIRTLWQRINMLFIEQHLSRPTVFIIILNAAYCHNNSAGRAFNDSDSQWNSNHRVIAFLERNNKIQ